MNQESNDKLNRMIKQILSQRNDLSESDILEKIKRKKSEVGSGFLTDLGAIYLVLNELGIKIDQKYNISIGEITSDLKGTDIECHYLSSIKLPGRTVFYVFDKEKVIRGILWGNDKKTFDGLQAGQGIILKKATIKEAQDGSFEIHMNDQSDILKKQEVINIMEACSELKTVGPGVYRGTVEGPIRELIFKRKDGSDGKGTAFFLKIGEQKIRAVIWTQKNLEIREGQELVIGPLNVKRNNYGTELSGDDSTIIIKVGPKFTLIDGDGKHFIAVNDAGKLAELEFDSAPAGKTILAKEFEMRYPNFKIYEYEEIKEENPKPMISKISGSGQELVNIEFIVLSDPAFKSNGYYEILIGDDSGEGKIVVDKENFNKLSALSVGQKVSALGVHGDGQRNFRVTNYTIIKTLK